MQVTVGHAGVDFVGDCGTVIQAALEAVATAGGGTVMLQPGVYTLSDSLRMPGGTRLVGAGEETVLRKDDGWEAPLWEDGDWGDCWVCCDPQPPVSVGQGVTLSSDVAGGFLTTVGTVLEVAGSHFRLSRRFNTDTMVSHHARAAHVFPLIAVEECADVEIRNLALDGNAAHNPIINGCRGGGVWGLFSERVTVAGVSVRRFNGDAISFQQSHDWVVEDCTLEDNTGVGLHPGSGSQRPIIRRCTARRNSGGGMFVCWRVKFGKFTENLLEDNTGPGISVGHKDTDNLFTDNRILRNSGAGIQLRDETFPMAPHRCRFERNTFSGNNPGGAQVILTGDVHNLVFQDNQFEAGTEQYHIDPRVANPMLDVDALVERI